jgi:3'-phosphoadenosine 5'-phosphosulfate sulfotransferase (PAPS reductase)/FAD synthetase
MINKNICVWFSSGAASAVAAKLIIDKYKKYNNILVVNNPIQEEHPDNKRFLKDIEKWINHPIISHVNPKFPNHSIVEVFEKIKYMSNVNGGASCTYNLKKKARYDFEKNNNIDFHVLGFTYDEKKRHERFVKFERTNVIPILIENKITKGRCLEILSENNIKIPYIYKLGFPNANCIGCVKSQSPTYWNLVRKHFPDDFKNRAQQSRKLGVKLVKRKGDRIFLDELKPSDKGGKIKSFECGIFCDNY